MGVNRWGTGDTANLRLLRQTTSEVHPSRHENAEQRPLQKSSDFAVTKRKNTVSQVPDSLTFFS